MRDIPTSTAALLCAGLFCAAVIPVSRPGKGPGIAALVYHETTGFRHPSIPFAIEQLTAYGAKHGIEVTADQARDNRRKS